MTSDIAANLATIHQRIDRAAAAAGRSSEEIRLLPVSKTKPPEAVLEAYAAGEPIFGENKVQEAQAKAEALADTDIRWAVIGHLQTNKAKQLVRFADEFQALDSAKVAAELDKRLDAADRTLEVLLEVNTSGEESKFGVSPAHVVAFARELRSFERLDVRGLMTIATNTSDADRVGACFDDLAGLRQRLRDELGGDYPELSMGMSGDFELAIARGATCVRIGTAIFGARPPLPKR
ncbi:YggS family pyridoxal phosphate-dependent enzyme [Corynebacterium vitaeruminis]|uniref:YggS family pyridoxal phosphate-dependent enzyme n=1 Tax=Corynebacterium vitaeruminis TaxID=38305 RepID=UPI0023F72777|nr:YggS family pyridoxal phosphate-dependent enzyme [Corynebacterium vitaeruminis]